MAPSHAFFRVQVSTRESSRHLWLSSWKTSRLRGCFSIELMGDSRLPASPARKLTTHLFLSGINKDHCVLSSDVRSTKILAFGKNSHGGFALWITSSCMGFGMFRLTETGQACGHDN